MKSIINREQAELKQRFLLGGGPLGRIPIPPGPHGVQGEDGGADSDGGHDRHIYVEDAIKVVAHGGEHGLQFHRPICGQDMQSGAISIGPAASIVNNGSDSCFMRKVDLKPG